MSMNKTPEQVWGDFLQRWPQQALAGLTLAQYARGADEDCFSGWLRYLTNELGWRPGGGTHYPQIGVSALPATSLNTYRGNPNYGVDEQRLLGWLRELGTTAEEAFAATRARLCELAEAAARGDISVLSQPVLYAIYEWKLFFIYQSRQQPVLLPLHRLDNISQWYHGKFGTWLKRGERPKESDLSFALRCNQQLMAARDGLPVFDYVTQLEQLAKARDLAQENQQTGSGWTMPSFTPRKYKMPALNQILYGPPGTGKTYETIYAALQILDPAAAAAYKQVANDKGASPAQRLTARAELKARFDALSTEQRVRFVTFHQSFSYEDFVEGLRAETVNGQVQYRVADGVFKQICADARHVEVSGQSTIQVADDAKIWKVSIGGTAPSPLKDYCLKHGQARIGWSELGDMRQLDEHGKEYLASLGSNNQNTVHAFAHEIEVGDVIVSIDGQDQIGAVGVVTRDYFYEELPAIADNQYPHAIGVDWLYKNLSLPAKALNDGKPFVQKTVYQLWRFKWPLLLEAILKSGARAEETVCVSSMAAKLPRVLIIDEINRGNISRIFGELITLIEPSKRAGAEEALSVTLPYSKERFSVPDNVYIIGTMNTADRSLAGLDLALRRRFSFTEMPPRPELLDEVVVEEVNIGQMLRVMNQRITVLLDRDHTIGHAYFIPLQKEGATLAELADIFRQKILPLLQEYFFEDWERIRWVLNDHRKPDSAAFIVEDKSLALQVLFGDVHNKLRQTTTWKLNPDAFANREAYRGIAANLGQVAAAQSAAEEAIA